MNSRQLTQAVDLTLTVAEKITDTTNKVEFLGVLEKVTAGLGMNDMTRMRLLNASMAEKFKENKPEYGKIYSLTSANGPSIAGGNTWAESEIKEEA